MTRLLKQSIATTLRMGPFVDSTDGVTAETGLTISQADIQISKNGGAFAQTSDAAPTTTHDADGWYPVPLTTTDTGTLGPLTVQVAMAGALPVWEHFMVVPANVYDSLVAGTDLLDANVAQWLGATAPANTGDAFAGTTELLTRVPDATIVSVRWATTDVASGTALRAAILAATAGQTVWIGPGDFDFGGDATTGRVRIPDRVTVRGSGRDVTRILSQHNASGSAYAIVSPGNYCEASDFTVVGNGTAISQLPFGVAASDAAAVGWTARNVRAIADTDGFYVNNAAAVEGVCIDCLWTTNYDAGYAGGVGAHRLWFIRNQFCCIGPSAVGTTVKGFTAGAAGGANLLCWLIDCAVFGKDGADSTIGINAPLSNVFVFGGNVHATSATGTVISISKAIVAGCEYDRATADTVTELSPTSMLAAYNTTGVAKEATIAALNNAPAVATDGTLKVDVTNWKTATAPAMTGDAYAAATAVQTILTGITSLAQWLGLIAGKQVGNSTARTELRATGAGSGTFDETTDSQEAIRDNIGAAGAGLTAITGVALAATGANLIVKTSTFALAIADAVCDEALSGHTTTGTVGGKLNAYPYNVTPLTSTVSAGAVTENKLTAYQRTALGPYTWTIVDSSSNPVSLAGKTVRFNVSEIGTVTPTFSYSSTGSEITISGSSNNVVTLTADDTNTGTAGLYQYALLNYTDDTLLNKGTLKIVPTVAST